MYIDIRHMKIESKSDVSVDSLVRKIVNMYTDSLCVPIYLFPTNTVRILYQMRPHVIISFFNKIFSIKVLEVVECFPRNHLIL